jgi:dGTPase
MMPLAPYAADPGNSRGRLVAETHDALRTCFQRDRDRIVHSTAFRRLKHKTQVFISPEGDHFRTRLTHSLEVAQIARTISRALGLNEDLAEGLALAHDIGHPPFGHAGEDALDTVMRPFGGFNHNEQTVRTLTWLEHRYIPFRGLNLTWEMLEGIIKHNGPVDLGKYLFIAEINREWDLWPASYAGLEAQIASLADDIAYTCHDIDDGMRSGIFGIADLRTLPYFGDRLDGVLAAYPDAPPTLQVNHAIRALMTDMVLDLLTQTRCNLERHRPDTADAVRLASAPLAAFSAQLGDTLLKMKDFMHSRLYRHAQVNRAAVKSRRLLTELFTFFLENADCLPQDWRLPADVPKKKLARHIADYIAGMTDRFAMREYQRLLMIGD